MDQLGERSIVVEPPSYGVLGTLWLVGRKTGLDMQSFPIDAERVTIGRDIDCDVRLYFSDVSKLHCEIVFDLLTGQASLHVHGTHGLKHASQGGVLSTIKPPTIITLSDRDTFVVRKKLFRFEYGHEEIHIETPTTQTQPLPSDSPVKGPASPAPLAAPRRKRASHRMSLVPSGKSFEPLASPMKNRRHSIIGLGEGPQVICTPRKSRLVNEITEELEEGAEDEEVIVEALDGEEGDVVYLEARENEDNQRPVHQNPFMTPQQKRKAPLRNTSAVPRTRKLVSIEHSDTTPQVDVASEAEPPRTPTSVPLPEGGETPYTSRQSTPAAPQVSPRSVPLPPVSNTPYHVPAQVALSTPRGPVSLHKALLLRSARKAWQSSQAQGIDGAIQSGDVSVRRKSLSPVSRDSRKSLTPMPEAPVIDDEVDEQSDEEDDQGAQPGDGELQWVYEDGSASVSIDESDSSVDSLEADQSLDIPGQGVLSFSPSPAERPEVAAVEQAQDEEEQEHEEEHSIEDEEGEMEDEFEDVPAIEHGTPVARNLDRFYTPQPRRNAAIAAPRTLSSIGGPAVRFQRVPETPSGGVRRVPPTPRSLGPPSRRVIPTANEAAEDEQQDGAPSTPVRRELDVGMLEEAKRRRETLGTPRDLPAPPRSFKTPVREFPSRSARKTGPHPALAAHTPEQDDVDADAGPAVPLTPVQSVQRKLDTLRRQSLKRQSVDANRRATVGFVLPSTPAQSHAKPSAAYTVAGNRRAPAPAPVPEESEAGSLPPTPTFAAVPGEGDISSLHAFTASPESHDDRHANGEESGPATPQYAGLKQMFRSVLPPQTPSFAGVRSMFATTSAAEQATPHYNGMKEMFHEPATVATPEMSGVKSMFAEPKTARTPRLDGVRVMFQLPQDPATPAMDGLKEMYELEEVDDDAALQADTESEEEEEIEDRSDVIICVPPPPIRAAPSASQAATKASRSIAAKAPARGVASKLPTASAPVRKQTASANTTQKASGAAPVRKSATSTSTASRSRDAPAASVPKRNTTEAKKAAVQAARPRPGDIDFMSESEVEEPLEYEEPPKAKSASAKPARSTASRAKKDEPAAKETVLKPTRAKKAVLGENEDQPPAPAPAKTTRAKTATSSATSTAKASTTASTSNRKTRTVTAEKENEPAAEPAVKKAPARRTVKKAEPAVEPVPEAAPTTRSRATRSKK